MKVLYLPLKKRWYEMIERGEKREEYRKCTPYWIARLRCKALTCYDKVVCRCQCSWICWDLNNCGFETFDVVCFSLGYTKQQMSFAIKGISIGQGRPEWGAPLYETFIIKLGERIENIKKEIQ